MVLIQKLGPELARRLMGHQAGGRAIHDIYDQRTSYLDLASQMLEEESKTSEDLPDVIQPYLGVFSKPGQPQKSIAALVRADPHLQTVVRNIDILEACQKAGSNAWMTHEAFKLDEESCTPWRDEEIVQNLLSMRQALKMGIHRRRVAESRENWATAQQKKDLDLTSEIKQRFEKGASLSGLPAALAQEEREMSDRINASIKADAVASWSQTHAGSDDLELSATEPSMDEDSEDHEEVAQDVAIEAEIARVAESPQSLYTTQAEMADEKRELFLNLATLQVQVDGKVDDIDEVQPS